MSETTREYAANYRQPPLHTCFKKGRSGNPRSARAKPGRTAPALPVSAVVSGVTIAVCFAPEEDCAAFTVRAINNAAREILVGAYGLTTGSGIVEALIRAKERGVDVQLIADKTTPRERASGIEPWPRQGSRSG